MTARHSLLPLALAALVAVAPAVAPTPGFGQGGTDQSRAAALLAAAERRGREGDPGGALADYEQLIQQFPDSPQAPEALLRIARGQLAAGDRAASLATVERLVKAYAGAPQAAAGLLLEGRIRSERPTGVGDLEAARKTLEKVWLLFPRVDYPALPARSAARVLDGRIARRLHRGDEAMSSFLEVLEMEPGSPWSARAQIGFGTALVEAGDWQAGAESLQDALAFPDITAEVRALARRRLALLERRLIRPAVGTKLWQRAGRLTISGAEPRRLTGVALDEAGRLLAVDSGADQLLLLSDRGTVDQRWTVRDGEKPSWDRDGNAQLATDDAALLPGETSKQFRAPGRERALDGIRAVERGPFGEWIVLASRSTGVLAYPAGRGAARTLIGGDGDPVDLATDAFQRLYVLEKRSRRVVRIDPHADHARETVVTGGWRQAAALSVDPFGFVHVLDAGAGRVHTYDENGQEIGAVGPVLPGGVELRKAEDLAAASDGRLFIADARTGLVVVE